MFVILLALIAAFLVTTATVTLWVKESLRRLEDRLDGLSFQPEQEVKEWLADQEEQATKWETVFYWYRDDTAKEMRALTKRVESVEAKMEALIDVLRIAK